jgi:hypothetical protein
MNIVEHPLCRLCVQNEADKRNSHIIPKFLLKGLFEFTKPRHTVSIDRSGKERTLQDTPKEDHILCAQCEKRFAVLETYFARIFESVHNYSNAPNEFKVKTLGVQKYLECVNIHPALFKLFICSLIWRASISKALKLKLPASAEEDLRTFLNDNAKLKKEDLIKSTPNIIKLPIYHFIVIKPEETNVNTRGVFTSYNLSEESCIMFLVRFVIVFYWNESEIDVAISAFSNKQNEIVKLSLAQPERWQEINQLVVSKLLS